MFPWEDPAQLAQQETAYAAQQRQADPMASIMSNLSPMQKQMLALQALSGAQQALAGMPRGGGIGGALGALGSGMTQGGMAGLKDIFSMQGAQQQRTLAEQQQRVRQTLAEQAAQKQQMEAAKLDRQMIAMEGLEPEQQQLIDLFGTQAIDRVFPKPPAPMTDYQRAQLDLAERRLGSGGGAMTDYQRAQMELARQKFEFDRSKPTKAGGDQTALMQNAQYLARVKGIPESEAAEFLMKSSAARSNPSKTRDDIFKTMLSQSYGDVQEAWKSTDQAMRLLEGGPEALPEKPEEGTSKGVWAAIKGMFGGGGEEPAAPETAAAPPAGPAPPAAPPPGAMQGQGMALPPDRSALQPGQVYQLPDGRMGRFDGQQFELIE